MWHPRFSSCSDIHMPYICTELDICCLRPSDQFRSSSNPIDLPLKLSFFSDLQTSYARFTFSLHGTALSRAKDPLLLLSAISSWNVVCVLQVSTSIFPPNTSASSLTTASYLAPVCFRTLTALLHDSSHHYYVAVRFLRGRVTLLSSSPPRSQAPCSTRSGLFATISPPMTLRYVYSPSS